MGHVFAGLAASELGRPAEARQHYRTAISLLPSEPLAWKVSISVKLWSFRTFIHSFCAIFAGFTQFI